MWTDISVTVKALVNHSASERMSQNNARDGSILVRDGSILVRTVDPPPPPVQPDYVKVCGGCGDTSIHGLSYGSDFCIKLDEFCMKDDEFCMKDDEFCMKDDEFV